MDGLDDAELVVTNPHSGKTLTTNHSGIGTELEQGWRATSPCVPNVENIRYVSERFEEATDMGLRRRRNLLTSDMMQIPVDRAAQYMI